jgi:hypothetical protein
MFHFADGSQRRMNQHRTSFTHAQFPQIFFNSILFPHTPLYGKSGRFSFLIPRMLFALPMNWRAEKYAKPQDGFHLH